MRKIKDGGPAFPCRDDHNPTGDFHPQGMSLRDWYAGQALMGILAGGFADTVPHHEGGRDAAFFALMYADAMIEMREPKP